MADLMISGWVLIIWFEIFLKLDLGFAEVVGCIHQIDIGFTKAPGCICESIGFAKAWGHISEIVQMSHVKGKLEN